MVLFAGGRYLDDQLSSVRIAGNTFDHHEGMVLELGGGRHNEFVRAAAHNSELNCPFAQLQSDAQSCKQRHSGVNSDYVL